MGDTLVLTDYIKEKLNSCDFIKHIIDKLPENPCLFDLVLQIHLDLKNRTNPVEYITCVRQYTRIIRDNFDEDTACDILNMVDSEAKKEIYRAY